MNILLLEDEKFIREPLKNSLESLGQKVFATDSKTTALRTIDEKKIQLALIDIHLKKSECELTKKLSGIDILRDILALDDSVTCVVLSSDDSEGTLEEAFSSGASDYLQKPILNRQLKFFLKKINTERKLKEGLYSRYQSESKIQKDPWVESSSEKYLNILKTSKKLKGTDLSILILGETGTGKDHLARKIWEQELNPERPFVAINCSAIPEKLLESELFGFEKNAFSGAQKSKPGLIELADGGDLFLDEIGSLSKELQGKLLRVLQDKKIRRLGATQEKEVSFRCIAATNENIQDAITSKRFREDLFHRLRGAQFTLPPLRERTEDLENFAKRFTEFYSSGTKTISQDAIRILKTYSWPGNIRELQQSIKTMVIFSESEIMTPKCLPDWIPHEKKMAIDQMETDNFNIQVNSKGDLAAHLDTVEKSIIIKSLRNSRSITDAAIKLGINRGSIDYKIKRHGIHISSILNNKSL